MPDARRDNRWYIERLLKIRTKRGPVVPFKFNVAQDYYWRRRGTRNIVLKPRQEGMSKVIDADQYMDCIRKTTNAIVISHETEATKRLFAAVKFFHDKLEVKPLVATDNANTMTFPKRGSSYWIGTAGQRAIGRGDTTDRAHLSEAAFYHDLKSTLAGVSEAAEYGQIDIESTANGRGNHFYVLTMEAVEGRSPYRVIFIPWYIVPEHDAARMTPAEIAGLSEAAQKLLLEPDEAMTYTDEEKALKAHAFAEYGVLMTPGAIRWRRYKIWDKADLFFQEYPEDIASAFLQSGRPVFRTITLDRSKRIDLEKACGHDNDDTRALRKHSLVGGVDGAEGVRGGDRHVFSVIDMSAKPPAVIFEIADDCPYELFDARIAPICDFFDIALAVEGNGIGGAHVKELRDLGVSFTEINTTGTNRGPMLLRLEAAYRKGELIETYEEAKNEALDMVYSDSNRPDHPEGKHDDRVFSRAIALEGASAPEPNVR